MELTNPCRGFRKKKKGGELQRKREIHVDLETVLLTEFSNKKQVHTRIPSMELPTCVVHAIIPAQMHSSQKKV